MIPNGFGVIEPVRQLEENESEEVLDGVKGLILPKQLHKDWFENKDEDTRPDSQIIDQDYKLKLETPYYLAMEHGWDGVGFLLNTMRQDKFEALTACLKAQKYGKFLDMLDNVPREVVTQKDDKGRNLLLILTRHIGEIDHSSEEMTKVLDVLKVLTRPVATNSSSSKKQAASLASVMTCTEQKGCGLKIDSKDSRGYNLFHNLAIHSNLNNFKHIFNHLIGVDKAQTIQLLTQQASVKSKGTPIILMLQYLDL